MQLKLVISIVHLIKTILWAKPSWITTSAVSGTTKMEQVGTVIFIPTMVAFLFMTLYIKTSLQRCFRTLITDQFHLSKQMCKTWWSQYTTKITVQEETLTFSIIMEASQIVNQTNSVIFGRTLSQVFANITLTLLILSVTTVIK